MGVLQLNQNNIRVITTCPAEEILWQYIDANREITRITPTYFTGLAAGTPFVTYAAGVVYLALKLGVSFTATGAVTNPGYMQIYTIANVLTQHMSLVMPVWDTTAAGFKYSHNSQNEEYVVFGRVVLSIYTYIQFIGYSIAVT